MNLLELPSNVFGYFRKRALRDGERMLKAFVSSIHPAEDKPIGGLLAAATIVRVKAEINQVIPVGIFWEMPIDGGKAMAMQSRLDSIVRQFVKQGSNVDASACQIWALSVRAMLIPEYRPLGRALWTELHRGDAYVEDALREGAKSSGQIFDPRVWQEWHLSPAGLAPDEAE